MAVEMPGWGSGRGRDRQGPHEVGCSDRGWKVEGKGEGRERKRPEGGEGKVKGKCDCRGRGKLCWG